MRALAALLLTASLYGTGCPELPPCHMVQPGLTVLIAESLVTRDSSEQPVPFQLVALIHGDSPGNQFNVQLSKNMSVKKGDRYYIEDIQQPGQPISLHCLTTSGLYSERTHAPRIQYFRDLNAGIIRDASLNVSTMAPGANVTITGPAGIQTTLADRRGDADWKALLPGVYQIQSAKPNYRSEKPTAPFELMPGACRHEQAHLISPYTLRGTLRTPAGVPVRHTILSLYAEGTYSYEAETNDNGAFTLPYIHPGTYRIRLLHENRRELPGEIIVPASPFETEVQLTLK